MSPASVAVRIVAAIGLMLIVGAMVYALSNGRVFLLPFLLLIGFPMAMIFRRREPPANPPRISLN